MKTLLSCLLIILHTSSIVAQKSKVFQIKSPNGKIELTVEAGKKLIWSAKHNGQEIILPSVINMKLYSGNTLGENVRVASTKTKKIRTSFKALNYKKAVVTDNYNLLTINFKGNYGILFRVYDDGLAYRFIMENKGTGMILSEEANFNFAKNYKTFVPISWDYRNGKIFNHSFEALYREIPFSEFPKDSLAFLPVLVDVGNNKKVAILEADLENYPGMYLDVNETKKGFKAVFAHYPLEEKQGGYENMNYIPTKRADYIATTNGTEKFPWRAIVISTHDKELLDNDMVQKLAAPSRLEDVSWIKPGLSAWDWWNNWNLTGVDFEAGMNTKTYKAYIDFAAKNKLQHIIIDWGWSSKTDLSKVNPAINLQEIVDYGKKKGVGVFIWASWHALLQQLDKVMPLYEKIGVQGLKIDFVDRDDQIAVASLYKIAKKAAQHKLLVDYHGVFKPTGLQRTYPNVVGYEGVKGLENVKWAIEDAPRYAVSIPFIRMMAGPMDYTPGAMRNSNKANFRPIEHMPMSQGTRCHQLAMYVMYEAPFQMLSDNPIVYTQEQECTDFISSVPTTFDKTVALDGKVAEFCAIARKKGQTWYVGTMTNWKGRELTLDFSFLEPGTYKATVFKDGVNANKDARDYKKEQIEIKSGDKINIKMMNGGGWAARIEKK
jgi:alpha-glucosidase